MALLILLSVDRAYFPTCCTTFGAKPTVKRESPFLSTPFCIFWLRETFRTAEILT